MTGLQCSPSTILHKRYHWLLALGPDLPSFRPWASKAARWCLDSRAKGTDDKGFAVAAAGRFLRPTIPSRRPLAVKASRCNLDNDAMGICIKALAEAPAGRFNTRLAHKTPRRCRASVSLRTPCSTKSVHDNEATWSLSLYAMSLSRSLKTTPW